MPKVGGRPARVAIIGSRGYPSYYGGFETAVRRLAPHLASRGWSVTVYGRPGSVNDKDRTRDRRVASIVTRGVDTKKLSTLTFGFTSTVHATRRRPDVALVLNVANGYWLPLLRLRGVPTLVNVDGIEWERAKWGRLARFVFRVGAWLTGRFASELVFDSTEIARRWADDYGRDGHFIPYGGDLEGELPIEPGLPHGGYVLMVARFVPENTVPEFLDAARELAKRWDVVIVGSSGYGGPIEDMAHVLAQECHAVRWLGHISDDIRLHSLWQHAGVYFHGHSVGGTNPALVQAMASGAPIVARDTVYNKEVLADAGLFVGPQAEEIVRVIGTLMEDDELKRALSLRAMKRAREQYSWQDINAGYEQALLGLVSGRE